MHPSRRIRLPGGPRLRARAGALAAAVFATAALAANLAFAALPSSTAPASAHRAATPSDTDTTIAIEDIGFLPAEAFDIGDGLPALSVVAAAVTPDDEAWLATMRGLVRHDGRRFVPEPGPGGVFSGAMSDLAATPDGKVWASTPEAGVFVRDQGRWRNVGYPLGLPPESGKRLRSFQQRGGYRLFSTGRGTVHEWDGARWQPWNLPTQLGNTEIFDVLLQAGADRDEDQLWVASFGLGLWHCMGRAPCTAIPMTTPGPRFNEIISLAQWTDPVDGSPILWVASYGGGLARLQHGKWQRLLADDKGLPSNFLQRLLVFTPAGQSPHLWIGTRNGVAHRVGEHWMPLDATSRFEGTTVKALGEGRDASGVRQLWIGSDHGAARLPMTGAWRTISQVGQRGNGVWSVLQEVHAGREQLWVGSDGDGLLRYAGGAWKQFRVADGLPSDMVRSVARDPVTDDLLVGTWGGELSRFDGKRFHLVSTPWKKSDQEAISSILFDRDGITWFTLRESGLARLRAGHWTVFGPDDGYPSRIYDVQRVGEVLWASSNTRGIARIDTSRWRYFSRAEGLPDSSFFALSLIPDAAGRPILWAGSLRAGVVRLDVSDPEKPRVVTQPALPPVPDPFVYEIVPDGRGSLFLSSNYGASLWTPRPDGSFHALDYHRGDGLPHDEGNYGALQVDGGHRIWLGTLGGLGVFAPPTAESAARATPLLLESLTVDRQAVDPARWRTMLALGPGRHDLRFQVALRTGRHEADIRYRSQLVGLETVPSEWSADNARSFSAIPPGDYTLRIEARDGAGMQARPISLSLSIPLPWWRGWPAALAAIAFVVLLMVTVIRLRERQQRLREQHLVDLVRQRTSELETRGVELRRINEELTRLSYHDPLTDLANRRMLLERLHGEWDLAVARDTPLAFLLFDLDQFKAYNDQRGHLAGDDCLREIGRRIDSELLVESATAGRYGGEEFGVVLPGMTMTQAMAEGERIRAAIESAALSHPSTPSGLVTTSVGVASMLPRAGFSAEVLIAAADAALYRAKAAGKNRVEAASP